MDRIIAAMTLRLNDLIVYVWKHHNQNLPPIRLEETWDYHLGISHKQTITDICLKKQQMKGSSASAKQTCGPPALDPDQWTANLSDFHHSNCQGFTRGSSKVQTVKTCWNSITVFYGMLPCVSPQHLQWTHPFIFYWKVCSFCPKVTIAWIWILLFITYSTHSSPVSGAWNRTRSKL